jgi:transposase-like protein
MDETYVGGKEKNKHAYLRTTKMPTKALMTSGPGFKTWHDKKVVVAGILQTDGKVITQKVPNAKAKTLIPMVERYVGKGATVVTDEHVGYLNLTKLGYVHQTVNHGKAEYVRGEFHTNGIENFWSLFKRGIIGIYHQVSVKHLDKYLDEFEFRYNTRKLGEAQRFNHLLTLCNQRLTYPQLIAKYGEENTTTVS